MTSVNHIQRLIDYEEILKNFQEYQERKIEKKREKAYRIDLAKRWIAMGLSNNEVQAVLGITLNNVMNIYNRFPKKVFKEDLEEIYKKDIEEVKKIHQNTLEYIIKTTDIKLNKEDFLNNKLNITGVKKISQAYDKYKNKKESTNTNILNDFISQIAILKTDDFFNNFEKELKDNKNISENNLKKNKEIKESYEIIDYLSKYQDKQENFIAKALISEGIKKKYQSKLSYNMMLINADLKPHPKKMMENQKKDDDEEENKKKNKNKLCI